MSTVYREVLQEVGQGQVRTHEQGVAYQLDNWARLRRFLILGSDGGSFYVSPRALTAENAAVVQRCIATDPHRTQSAILEVYTGNVAPKVDPALFALALLAADPDPAVRKLAYNAIPLLRIGTHLFQFIGYAQALRGALPRTPAEIEAGIGHKWSKGLVRAVGRWYTSRTPDQLAYQLVKYQQREGWSHRDLLRLAHVKPHNKRQDAIFAHVTQDTVVKLHRDGEVVSLPPQLAKVLLLRIARPSETAFAARTIRDARLTREMVPTEFLTSPEVWDALLADMPLTAMIRNLGTMSKVGLLVPGSDAVTTVVERLGDAEHLARARVHPLAVLLALRTYEQGHGYRGSGQWTPVRQVIDALDAAFYLSFGNVPSTGKRILLALDVSSSMTGNFIANSPLDARTAAAAMALVTAAVEPGAEFVAYAHKMVPITISPRQRLDDVVRAMAHIRFGGTFCALPVMWAMAHNRDFDAIVSYTDSETKDATTRYPVLPPFGWTEMLPEKPMAEYLRNYRAQRGIPTRGVVVGMVSNGFTLADPTDPLSLDVVGFDASAPAVIGEFVKGEIA